MSYELKIENKYGEQLQLTGNSDYCVTATGLSPVASNIITASVANYGGEKYITSRQQKRNIVLTIYVNQPVELNRINLYKYIKSDDWIRVYFKNNRRNVYIDGYVESFELDHFAQTQTAQVSIICPQPSFISMTENHIKNADVTDAFYFPFNTEINKAEGASKLVFTGLKRGILNFNSFLAEAETSQDSTPTPTAPAGINGLGDLNNSTYYIHLKFDSGERTTQVTIPLSEQTNGTNLVKGGASLIDENNFIVNNIFTDSDNNVLVDGNNNILYE